MLSRLPTQYVTLHLLSLLIQREEEPIHNPRWTKTCWERLCKKSEKDFAMTVTHLSRQTLTLPIRFNPMFLKF